MMFVIMVTLFSDARGGGVRCTGQDHAGVQTARIVQTHYGGAGIVYVPAGMYDTGRVHYTALAAISHLELV